MEYPPSPTPDPLLHFWFEELTTKDWWVKDAALDARLRERFLATLEAASKAELFGWRRSARGRLAEVIVLDQFSRNVFRDTPRAFAQDPLALGLAQEAVLAGACAELSVPERGFLLMPYMHSESALVHVEGERLFGEWAPNLSGFALQHRKIIDRFGRYPHRNEILGRESTPEELAFLKEPASSF